MKVAWFRGDARESYEWDGRAYSQDELLAFSRGDARAPRLQLLLVPDDADTSGLSGDDWNDRPANCNASDPYAETFPPGSIMVEIFVGDLLDVLPNDVLVTPSRP